MCESLTYSRYASKEKLQQVDAEAAYGRHQRKRSLIEGKENRDYETDCSQGIASGGFQNCRKGHYRERHVGNVVEKGADEPVFYRLSEHGKGQYPYHVSDCRHYEYVDVNIVFQSSSSFGGNSKAKTVPRTTVRMIILFPSNWKP